MEIQIKRSRRGPIPAVKLGASRQIVIPKRFYEVLGLTPGDYLEVERYKTNQLLITPKELVDKHPAITKRLEEAEKDVRAGRIIGPFNTAEEAVRALKSAKV